MHSCINQMNRDVLPFIFSIEHILQVHNLSPSLVKDFDLDIVKFFLGLISYFLVMFLEELCPCYLGNSSK